MNETGSQKDISAEAVPLEPLAGYLKRALPHMPDVAKPFAENLVKMIRNLRGHVRPAWATHESQTLQGKIRWQLAQLERALGGRNCRVVSRPPLI